MSINKIKIWFLTKPSWKIIVWTVIAFAYLGGIFTMILPPLYSSNARVLVVQKYEGIDVYTAIKSAEYLSEILENVIYSTEFMNDVLKSEFPIINNFGNTQKERKKQWTRCIKTDIIPHTGIIKIRVVNKDKNQAYNIARGIVYVLENKGEKYHGRGKMVEIKVIDRPNLPEKPDVSRVIKGIIISGIFGFLISFFILLIYRRDFRKAIIDGIGVSC